MIHWFFYITNEAHYRLSKRSLSRWSSRWQTSWTWYFSTLIQGIMIDLKIIFCLAEWKHGLIHGNSLVVFGDSKIFYGRIIDKSPTGICTYHLKDKCQIFCHFVQPSSLPKTSQSPNPRDNINANKLVALLPTFNLIIKVEG